MNDRLELLRQILENPDDDIARLCYAEQIESAGMDKYAELIRLQLRLGSDDNQTLHPKVPGCRCKDCVEFLDLRRREQDLLSRRIDFPNRYYSSRNPLIYPAVGWASVSHPEHALPFGKIKWSRGFITDFAGPWESWMWHHHRLFWSPISGADIAESAMPIQRVWLTTPVSRWAGKEFTGFHPDTQPGWGRHPNWPDVRFSALSFSPPSPSGASVDFSIQPEQLT